MKHIKIFMFAMMLALVMPASWASNDGKKVYQASKTIDTTAFVEVLPQNETVYYYPSTVVQQPVSSGQPSGVDYDYLSNPLFQEALQAHNSSLVFASNSLLWAFLFVVLGTIFNTVIVGAIGFFVVKLIDRGRQKREELERGMLIQLLKNQQSVINDQRRLIKGWKSDDELKEIELSDDELIDQLRKRLPKDREESNWIIKHVIEGMEMEKHRTEKKEEGVGKNRELGA